MPQDFVIPETKIGMRKDRAMAAKMEAINDIVKNRVGAELRPLASLKKSWVSSNAPEEKRPEPQGSQVSGELHTSPEPDTPGQEPAKNHDVKMTEEHQTSSEPDAPVEDQGETPESQVSQDVQGSEERESSSEPEVLDAEQSKSQELQATKEAEVSEELQTAVDADTSAEEGPEKEESVSDALEKQQTPVATTSALRPRWSPFRVRTNAVFGHVLHLFQPDWTHSADKTVATIKALADSPRNISPLIPPVTKMDLRGWVPYNIPSDMTSMVVMRFVPSNETNPSAQQTNPAPLLELRMKASDDEIIEIDSLRAVARTQVSDILFPSEVVDVRTTQRLEAELPGSVVDSMDGISPLLTFLVNSKLEIQEGQLLTPPRINNLGLPQWMFRDHHHEFVAHKKSLARSGSAKSNSGKEQAQEKKKGKEEGEAAPHDEKEEATLRPTSYVFAGLEVHRILETVYDGWKLAYTSIEAGQGGGRRAELSLEAVPGYDRDLRRTEEQVSSHEFLQSVYTLVRGLPGGLVKTRAPEGHKVRTTIEWLGAGKKGM